MNTQEQFKQFHQSGKGLLEEGLKINTWWVSNHGRVKITTNRDTKEFFPKLSRTADNRDVKGYLAISINDAVEKYVHRLVARFFIDNPENKRTVNHKDGDRYNNEVGNLEWATYQENSRHAISSGVRKYPTMPHILILRKKIWRLSQTGYSKSEISKQLNIEHASVSYHLSELIKKNQI